MKNRKALALILIPLLIFAGVDLGEAKPKKENNPVIIFHDQTPPEWNGVFARQVRFFNKAIPPQGPQIVYRRETPSMCATDIRACRQAPGNDVLYCGSAAWSQTDHERHIVISMGNPHDPLCQPSANTACHEMMHALLGIRDNYSMPYPDTSCVWGDRLTRPGSWDIQKLQERFGPPPHKGKKGKGGRRGR